MQRTCPCCGTAFPGAPDSYEGDAGTLGDICAVCWWEIDDLDSDGWSGANGGTLEAYRAVWQARGAKTEPRPFFL